MNVSSDRGQRHEYGIWENANYVYNFPWWRQQFSFTISRKDSIDRLIEVSHKRSDIHSISDFINKSTASNLTKESLQEIITNLVNKNFIINKQLKVHDSFRRNVAIVNSIIADTQHEDTADPNTVKSNIKT